MRFPRASVLLFLFAGLAICLAQDPPTQALMDEFEGPIRSVSSASIYANLHWIQPSGPTLVTPLWCRDCEYDRTGTRTKLGEVQEGRFHGQNILLTYDANGRVKDRFVTDAASGVLQEHDVMGPFGKLEETTYVNGKFQWRSVFSYDEHGHMNDRQNFAKGRPEGESRILMDADGNLLNRSEYDKNHDLRRVGENPIDLDGERREVDFILGAGGFAVAVWRQLYRKGRGRHLRELCLSQ